MLVGRPPFEAEGSGDIIIAHVRDKPPIPSTLNPTLPPVIDALVLHALARGRKLVVSEGDLLAIHSAGAYGMVLSSNYNSRPRAAEILVGGRTARLVRRRERVERLFADETVARL